MTILWSSITRI